MSLFPAYSDVDYVGLSDQNKGNILEYLENFLYFHLLLLYSEKGESSGWLQNHSYKDHEITTINDISIKIPKKPKKKHKKDSKKKDSRDRVDGRASTSKESKPQDVLRNIISKDDNFCIDVAGIYNYTKLDTIPRPCCPKYRRKFQNRTFTNKQKKEFLRYHKFFKKTKKTMETHVLEEITPKDEVYRIHLQNKPLDIEKWLEYIAFKETNPMKIDEFQNAKMRLEVIEKGLKNNPNDEQLMNVFLSTIVKVHPTDKVLNIIQELLDKDYNNFNLWNALITNKQSSMAQCIAPNVLKLYEKGMRSLFHKKDDEIMLRLFKQCAIFLRQAGLMEHFFCLIHLAINLNITSDKLNTSTFYSPEHNKTLIEYEEVILGSGLPLNEIWLRIEQLRIAYNYLPCINENSSSISDPQRIVINEDICGYIYPLTNKEYVFDLLLLILKLLKYPFNVKQFEFNTIFKMEAYENDYVENILSIFLHKNLIKENSIATDKNIILYNLIKTMHTPPSYINANLAHDTYFNIICEVLISCCEYFSDRKNIILLLLWLQLERIVVMMEKLNSKTVLSAESKKKVRQRIQTNLSKIEKYQNDINIYNEYALIEYEIDGFAAASNVYQATIQSFDEDTNYSDYLNLNLNYVEILIKECMIEDAIHRLVCLALRNNSVAVTATRQLLSLQKYDDRLKRLIGDITDDDENNLLLHYFDHDDLINTLKAKLYLISLIKSVSEACNDIEKYLMEVQPKNNRCIFIRENLFEIYINFIELRKNDRENLRLLNVVERCLKEFPNNTVAQKMCVFSNSFSWMKIRQLFNKSTTVNSILLLVAGARYRAVSAEESEEFPSSNIEVGEYTFKKRIINITREAIYKNPNFRQNALLWRLYLRSIYEDDRDDSLIKCKTVLYAALEACPWNKSLYVDGATCSPQELSQLIDLLLEKQLRVHAIPEELDILRTER